MANNDQAEYAAVRDYLFGLKPSGPKFGLDRMKPFAAALGNLERKVPVIHVAGTNGKGSVSAMLDAILRLAGWRTGLYTSPHLVNLGERVQVARRPLTAEEIIAYTRELRPVAGKVAAANPDDRPSFFEFMTAMAFLEFTRKRCDIAVLETGLGGRLDATNIVTPELTVITSIGLDHCELLGETIEKIAAEKAGIIKLGRHVVLGRVPPAADRVIREVAKTRDAPLTSVTDVYGSDLSRYPATNLEGDHQRWNAATATLAARTLLARWKITDSGISRALRQVDWPGRWQRVRVGGRLVILDAAHNPEAAQVLDTSLKQLVAETGRAPVVITGILGAARARPLVEAICRHAGEVHLTVPNQPRACTHDELEALVPAAFGGRKVRTTVEELFSFRDSCSAGGPDDVIVVTGSIYLLGEVMARLASAPLRS
ncbi:MAG: bifunctional folylpolyglutamate synthase/dihydrofolate synthase [Opitutus sp.]|nr:bifunctional folylpolyglutamate synthase/dihydrofolate synthase [Opitutus sp.]